MIITDLSVFPEEHRGPLNIILCDLAEVHRQHLEAHQSMCSTHHLGLNPLETSKRLDSLSFKAIELYRIQLDYVNKYLAYVALHGLKKYY